DGAIALFQAVLKRDANNARAKTALRKIAQALIAQAMRALEDRDAASAERPLQQAEAIAPDLPQLRAAPTNLRALRHHEGAGKPKDGSPADEARIDQLLGEADKALTAGNLIIPPGDSAYDKFRAVLRIDGNNAKAFAGLSRIPARAKELLEQALKDGTPYKAR